MSSHETTVVVRPSGEVLDVTEAPTERLAEAVEHIMDLRREIAETEQIIGDELVRRLDRGACWTLRVGDPSRAQWTISAPSPQAGKTGYDPLLLEAALAALIGHRRVDAAAAQAALERTVTVTVTVPFGHDLDALAEAVRDVDAIAGVPCRATSVSVGRKVSAKGVAALAKVERTGRALDLARVKLAPPARRVKVTAVRRQVRP